MPRRRRESSTTTMGATKRFGANASSSSSPSPSSASKSSFTQYTVVRGDTLRGISRKTHTRAEVILLLNPHASGKELTPGQVLDVPRHDAKNATNESTKAHGSFSGELYGESYPTLERKSRELAEAVRKTRGKRVGGDARGEMNAKANVASDRFESLKNVMTANVGDVVYEFKKVRANLLSAVAAKVSKRRDGFVERKTVTPASSKKVEVKKSVEKAKASPKLPAPPKASSVYDDDKKALEKKSKELAARERDLVAREKALAKAEADAQAKDLKIRSQEKKEKESASKTATAVVASKKKTPAMTKNVETPKEIVWTLAFTAGLGLLGHVFKTLGERYHFGSDDDESEHREEWHPVTVWRWIKEKLVFERVRGGGMRLTMRSQGVESSVGRKVGSTSNYIHSINFASQAAPVEAAVKKRVEETRAQVQTMVEGLKIRSIDELTASVAELNLKLDEDKFQTDADRVQTQEKLEATSKRLKEARGLLSLWVDQSAHSAYESNLKRKALTAFIELLSERYRRNKIMTKVFVRWQQSEMTAAFHSWCENARTSKIERLEEKEREIKEELAREKQLLVEKRLADEQRRAEQVREAEEQKKAEIEEARRQKAEEAKKIAEAKRAVEEAEIEAAKKAVAARLEETKKKIAAGAPAEEKKTPATSPTATPKKGKKKGKKKH